MKLIGKKQFSCLFSQNSEITNKKFKEAIEVFRLGKFVSFESVAKNYENLHKNYNLLPGVIGKDQNKSRVLDVHGVGDCAFLSLLAPLLGYVPDKEDKGGEVKTFRRSLATIVEKDPIQFVNIFGTMENLLQWTRNVRVPRRWDGTDVFSVFSKITKIVVHSVNLSNFVEKGTLSKVSHFVPNRNTQDWTTSIVVRYVNDNHYQCVIPNALPARVSVTVISSGNQESPEMDQMSEVDVEIDEKETRASDRRKTRFPKGPSQRERKGKYSKPGTAGDWSFMMPKRKAKDEKAAPSKKYESWIKNSRKNPKKSLITSEDESSNNPDDPDSDAKSCESTDGDKTRESNDDEKGCESKLKSGESISKEGSESNTKEEGYKSYSKKEGCESNTKEEARESSDDEEDDESLVMNSRKKTKKNLISSDDESSNNPDDLDSNYGDEAKESNDDEAGKVSSEEKGCESNSKEEACESNSKEEACESNSKEASKSNSSESNSKEEAWESSSNDKGDKSSSKKKVYDYNDDSLEAEGSDNKATKDDPNYEQSYEDGAEEESTEEESEEEKVKSEEVPPEKKSSKNNRAKLKIKTEWFSKTDVNGHKVSSYLRRVPDNLSQVFCSVDSTHIKIGSRGFSSVSDHIKTPTHKSAMEVHSSNYGIGHFASKFAATKDNQAKALMRLLLFVTNHNVAYDNIHCLIECCKAAFGDSEIAQSLKMGRTSATYKLIFGLGKTELDFTCKDLQQNPFAAALDCGTKGNIKRLEVHVRYWSDSLGRIVEKYWHTETTNKENALSVTVHFLTPFAERGIPLQNLIMCHCDNCSVLRGKRSGALVRIGEKAPQVLDCDVGGDGLHRMHNSNKKACKEVFVLVDKVLRNIKYDIRSSPAKVEMWIESAKIVGDPETMPESFCSSRWLDRFTCNDDLLTHVETAKHHYHEVPDPKGKKTYFTESETSEDDDLLENINSGKNEEGIKKTKKNVDEFKGNPAGRIRFLKSVFCNPKECFQLEMLLIISRDCMKSSFDFLRVFQGNEVRIHLLFPAYEEMMYETLLEIVEPAALKNSRGERLSGKEMKALVLETSEERKKRKEEEAREKIEESKGTSKKKKDLGFIRRAQLLPVKDTMLSSKLRKDVKILLDRYDIPDNEANEHVEKVKSLKSQYYVELVKAFQHYLPLDNDFLRYLKYLCPKRAMESRDTEAYFVQIAERLPTIEDDEIDDLRREIRILQSDKHKYLPELQTYNENFVDGFQLKEDKEKNIPIDIVWKPVIQNIEKFSVMSKMLKASLSIFHGTASVEGSINTTRNMLGDRSHSLKDKTLQAKKLVKSATKVNPNKCCYDFQLDDPNYVKDWSSAHANCEAFKLFNNIPDNLDDDSENETAHNSQHRRGEKRKTETDCNAKDDKDENEVKKKRKNKQKVENDDSVDSDLENDQNRNQKKIKKKRKKEKKVQKDENDDDLQDQNKNQKKTTVKKGASKIDKDSRKQNFQKEPKVQKKLFDFFNSK